MSINQYSIYSVISKTENKNSDDITKILEMTKDLEQFEDADKAKTWLKEHWDIKHDVSNFAIASNVRLTTSQGKMFFSVSVETEEEVNSYYYSV